MKFMDMMQLLTWASFQDKCVGMLDLDSTHCFAMIWKAIYPWVPITINCKHFTACKHVQRLYSRKDSID
jgi:hypothetical protein